MANIQLHKSNSTTELWYPITHSNCIDRMEGYSYTGDKPSGYEVISSADTLNAAIVKLEKNITKAANSGGGGGGGTVSGQTNRIAKFTSPNAVGDSSILEVYDNNTLTKVQVNTNIQSTGWITAAAANTSDIRLKTNIEPFKGLDIVKSMDFVKFNWNEKAKEVSDELKTDTTNYGVIAQNCEGVIDNFVFDITDKYKGVRYEKLIPIMAQAIKELSEKVDYLQSLIK